MSGRGGSGPSFDLSGDEYPGWAGGVLLLTIQASALAKRGTTVKDRP